MDESYLLILVVICVFFLLLVAGVLLFLIGYLYGRSQNSGVYHNKPISFFDQNKETTKQISPNIEIDEGKFVTNINTDNLSKKYDSLGDVKESSESIEGSVNKLKNLKR